MSDAIENEKAVMPSVPPTPPPIDIQPRKGGKTSYYNGSDADRLDFGFKVTDSLNRDPETRKTMEPFGYNQEKIDRFSTVHSSAASAHTKQQIENAEKKGAQDKFDKAFSLAKTELSNLVKVAKVALKNDVEKFNKLNLNGKKVGSTADILVYMHKLYEALLSDRDIVNTMSAFGYHEKKIMLCRDAFLQAQTLSVDLQCESAEAKAATTEKKLKMEELNEWMYDYYALAKVAYSQKPQE